MLPEDCHENCRVRARLREAMALLAGTHGFARVDAATLAAHTGVTVAEVRAHAPSLDGLLADAFGALEDRILAAYRAGFATQDGRLPRLAAGAAAVLALYQHRPWIARVAEVELVRAGPRSRDARDRARAAWVDLVASELERLGAEPGQETHLLLVAGAQCMLLHRRINDGGLLAPDLPHLMFELIAQLEPPTAPAR